MPPLPVVSGREALRAFQNDGWQLLRRESSHMILGKPGLSAILSIPDHRELKRGTLRGLIRTAGLTVDEFVDLLRL